MKYSNNFLKKFTTYFVSAGVVLFTAVGCSSSNENAEATNEPATEAQTEVAEMEENEAIQQTEMSDVETEKVVNTKPAIDRTSEEFRQMKELRERNRNNEVLAGINVKYGDWDADGDNALNEREFFDGFYTVWDFDSNDAISEEEFNKAAENLFINYEFSEYGAFSDWDIDANNELTKSEFMNGLSSIIASDAGQESASRLMTVWDLDNDEKIERIEMSNITVLLDADNN
ncbi:hypothetical protein [Tunicatimonas pelagia]|uniref:hypothetical protein n=1 Tax=Tunicatimonas pelagia TaxID=931531 RepID=UPI002666C859|nr:hypothetical protein [Tunicatimonas pelagia]WKN43538.1 hypothetical protein P0M28_00960 [Tunicatimonas pelagia]